MACIPLLPLALMAWNDQLTGAALNIAAHDGPSLRVIAGPGTGKTFAMMRRIARLLESGVDPSQILAVTFTRTSAKDLVDSLAALGTPGAAEVDARTLHSLSFAILHANGVFAVTGRHPRPIHDFEQEMLVNDLSGAFGGKRNVGKMIASFEAYWAKLQHETPGWPQDPQEQAFDVALKAWLRFHHSMLVGEVIPLAYDFVRQNPESPFVPRYSYILVDEYQDLNRADQALIEAVARGQASVTVVGDEDQSVYAFRHAHPEGITHYDRRNANTHDEVLDVCRRCPSRVVAMAAALIQRNRRARTSVIQARPGNPDGDVTIVQHRSLQDEADSIAAFISHYIRNHPDVHPGEVLVLTNRRMIGYAIRATLDAVAIAEGATWRARSFFAEECLETTAAQEGFALLALRVDPNDRAALRAWLGIGAPSNDGRAPAYARIRQQAENTGVSPRDVLEALDRGTLSVVHTAGLLERYRELKIRVAVVQMLEGAALVDALFPPGEECDEIRQIATVALADADDVGGLLEAIRTAATQPELPSASDDFVRIMSLHKSKGLTARVVVVAGCVNGAIPSFDPRRPIADQRDREEEQRRLFYVALTRTTETLVLSSAVRMARGEALQMGLPAGPVRSRQAILQASTFLAELGPRTPPTETTAAWRGRVGF